MINNEDKIIGFALGDGGNPILQSIAMEGFVRKRFPVSDETGREQIQRAIRLYGQFGGPPLHRIFEPVEKSSLTEPIPISIELKVDDVMLSLYIRDDKGALCWFGYSKAFDRLIFFPENGFQRSIVPRHLRVR